MEIIKMHAHVIHKFQSIAPYSTPADLEGLLQRAEQLPDRLRKSIGREVKGRIPIYREQLLKYKEVRGSFGDELHKCLQAANELNDLLDALEFLPVAPSGAAAETLRNAVKGEPYRTASPDTENFRNYIHELKVASIFHSSGLSPDLSTLTDVVIPSLGTPIECKRIASKNMFRTRAKEAVKQLEKRHPGRTSGAIFLDITPLLASYDKIKFVQRNWLNPLPQCNEVVDEVAGQALLEMTPLLSELTGLLPREAMSGQPIVVCRDFLGFQQDLVHERAIFGRIHIHTNPESECSQESQAIVGALGHLLGPLSFESLSSAEEGLEDPFRYVTRNSEDGH